MTDKKVLWIPKDVSEDEDIQQQILNAKRGQRKAHLSPRRTFDDLCFFYSSQVL